MIGQLYAVALDAPDHRGLSQFYAQLLGLTEHHSSEDWIALSTPSGTQLSFQLAPDHVAPQWPDPKHPQQMHLDLVTPDLEAGVARAVELGATRLPGGGDSWTVLADPAGHPFCVCRSEDAAELSLYEVAIDCPDGTALAQFYAAVLGYEVSYSGPEGAQITKDGAFTVMFQNVAEYHAPQWPDPAFPQQIHLDIRVDDVDAAETAVLALGAVKLGEGGDDWRVYADPAGHPFCLVF